MSSPARAFAWELASRHRLGLAAVGLYLTALGVLKLVVLGPGRRLALESELEFALIVIVPLGATFTYVLATFSFGLEGDIAGRRSLYPRRLFRLPVSNRALAGWPMLYGSSAIVLLWLATRALGLWPADVTVPWLWPAVLAAVMLVWTQVLSWTPLPIRGLRIALAVAWLGCLAFATILALYLEASERVMLLFLTPHLPLAYLVASAAVGAARRGSSSVWNRSGSKPESWMAPGKSPFKTAGRAQVWMEWQRFGRSLPLLVALVVPLELLLIVGFADSTKTVTITAIVVLLTPALLASFVAATLRRADEGHGDSSELSAFLARRPMSSAGLVGARLVAAALSVAAACSLVFFTLPMTLLATGNLELITRTSAFFLEVLGQPRAVVAGALLLGAPVALTWMQLTQSLVIGLSGRRWLVKASLFGTLTFLTLAVLLVPWALESAPVLAWVWRTLPAVLVAITLVRVASISWVLGRLFEDKLLTESRLVLVASLWTATVLALSGLLRWLTPSVLFPNHQLVLLALVMVPMARLSAAPLALQWSRHR